MAERNQKDTAAERDPEAIQKIENVNKYFIIMKKEDVRYDTERNIAKDC